MIFSNTKFIGEKFENKFSNKKSKIIYLSSLIVVNVIMAMLYFIFDHIYPNFIVYIGKPMLPITFATSKAIELFLLLIAQGLACLVTLVKLVKISINKNK